MNMDTCNDVCSRTAFMVFITSMKYNGNLGGLDGADAKCNALAMGKLPGTYKAWISGENMSAAQRLFHSDKPYIRPDKAKVADDWDDLLSADDLISAINRTETNMNIVGNGCNTEAQVWTNTLPDGSAENGDHCGDWKSSANNTKGGAGVATSKTTSWTDACAPQCDAMSRIYCFEQPPP